MTVQRSPSRFRLAVTPPLVVRSRRFNEEESRDHRRKNFLMIGFRDSVSFLLPARNPALFELRRRVGFLAKL
jgi:hypothetical protein